MQLLESKLHGPSLFEICTTSLVLMLCLGLFCIYVEVEGIEAEVHQHVDQTLKSSPLQWYAIDVDGQHVSVTGVVSDASDGQSFEALLRAEAGIKISRWSLETVTDAGLCQGRLEVFARKATISFKPGLAEFEQGSEPGIQRMASVIRHCAPRVEIGVHTSMRGDATLNLRLSERRAALLARALVQSGVVADQLIAQGFGEQQPVLITGSAADDPVNERITFRVRGKAV
jgi:outer membrane protein OmpA-like peptidoglycan-associated protein